MGRWLLNLPEYMVVGPRVVAGQLYGVFDLYQLVPGKDIYDHKFALETGAHFASNQRYWSVTTDYIILTDLSDLSSHRRSVYDRATGEKLEYVSVSLSVTELRSARFSAPPLVIGNMVYSPHFGTGSPTKIAVSVATYGSVEAFEIAGPAEMAGATDTINFGPPVLSGTVISWPMVELRTDDTIALSTVTFDTATDTLARVEAAVIAQNTGTTNTDILHDVETIPGPPARGVMMSRSNFFTDFVVYAEWELGATSLIQGGQTNNLGFGGSQFIPGLVVDEDAVLALRRVGNDTDRTLYEAYLIDLPTATLVGAPVDPTLQLNDRPIVAQYDADASTVSALYSLYNPTSDLYEDETLYVMEFDVVVPGGNVFASLAGTAVATATFAGARVATATFTGAAVATATFTATGIVLASADLPAIATATLDATRARSAALSGAASATLTLSATRLVGASVDLPATATMQADGARIATAALSGATIATATLSGARARLAAVSGAAVATATFTATSGAEVFGAVAGSVAATATFAPTTTRRGAVGFDASATATLAGTSVRFAAATLPATATATLSPTASRFAGLSGSATATATLNAARVTTAAVTFPATAGMIANATEEGAVSSATFDAVATMTADGARVRTATLAFDATATLAVDSIRTRSATLSGEATSAFVPIEIVVRHATVAGLATATMTASGEAATFATVDFDSSATFGVDARIVRTASITFETVGVFDITPIPGLAPAVVGMSALATMTVLATVVPAPARPGRFRYDARDASTHGIGDAAAKLDITSG